MATNKLILRHLNSVTYSRWRSEPSSGVRELCVCVSGYEARSITWAHNTGSNPNRSWTIFGFSEMPKVLSRSKNDAFYLDSDRQISCFSRDDSEGVINHLLTEIDRLRSDDLPLHVHVDYSCMPRRWYCNLPRALERVLRGQDKAFFWYTAGEYSVGDYPTAGVSDFHVFDGRSSLSAKFRTHLFGLGFDRIRANAICSVLDPQYLICFYADPGVREEYVAKVRSDNADILRQGNLNFTVPICDFAGAFTKLCAVVYDFHQLGDVILVPDGPKPLILASSLIPMVLGGDGLVCFHVARRKTGDLQPVDVNPTGECYGFSFEGIP